MFHKSAPQDTVHSIIAIHTQASSVHSAAVACLQPSAHDCLYFIHFGLLAVRLTLLLQTQVKLQRRQESLQKELEEVGEDMEKMAALLDEMEELNKNAVDLDMSLLDSNIDKMMPELGFTPEDSDQLVAAYRYTFALMQALCQFWH